MASNRQAAKQPVIKKPVKQEFSPEDYEELGLTYHEIMEVKEAFDLFDKNLDGSINPKELKDIMTSLGFEAKNNTVYQMISELDADKSGKIDFDEFLTLMSVKKSEQDKRENLQKVFALFQDDPKVNLISMKGLRRMAKDLGETVDDKELENMISKVDKKGDGQITFEEFYHLMSRRTFV